MKPEPPFLILGTRGRRGITFTASTQPKEVINLLGEPTEIWDDETDHCLRYSTDAFDIESLWGVVQVVGVRRFQSRHANIDFSGPDPAFHSEAKGHTNNGEPGGDGDA
jgi:hypothetical protein